jgi:hypothetical protein
MVQNPGGLPEERRRSLVEPADLIGGDARHVEQTGLGLAADVGAHLVEDFLDLVQFLGHGQFDPDLLQVRPQGLAALLRPHLQPGGPVRFPCCRVLHRLHQHVPGAGGGGGMAALEYS